jgi:uncharacterized protein YkwD
MPRAGWSFALALLLGASRPAVAAAEDELVALINARRAEARDCAGKRAAAAGPLAPSATLARADAKATSGDLGQALAAAGYLAANATTIVVSGPADASEAARFIEERECAIVRDGRYAEIGVARTGTIWRINLARPLLAEGLGDWRAAGRAVLELVNEVRRQPRRCGERSFGSAPPLAWNDKLAAAALAHSRDMAERNYFGHADPAGASVGQRVRQQGFRWRFVGENIAAGHGSAQQVVAGWLASPGHCANLMGREFAAMGAAYAIEPGSALEIYWTQVFGAD